MVERGRGFFQSFLGSFDRTGRQREALVELLLMAALADGDATLAEIDRIARAIETQDALRGLDWTWVSQRLEEIREDGPLFFETRQRLGKNLKDPELRRSGLSLAAQFLGTPLAEEERALLDSVADAFEIPSEERESLFAPWSETDLFRVGYVRCGFNNPDVPPRTTFIEALANTEHDVEFALLTYKLLAARSAMTRFSESTELTSLGEPLELAGASLRIDALLEHEGKSFLGRFLARGEALHPREHELMREVIARIEPSAALFIGYADALSPPDEAFLKTLDPDRVVIERLVF